MDRKSSKKTLLKNLFYIGEKRVTKNRNNNGQILSVDKERKAITNMLIELPWEWYCFTNLPHKGSLTDAEFLINRWREELATEEKVEIGYCGIFDPLPYAHAHLMLLGMNKDGKSLFHHDSRKEEERLAGITGQSVIIRPIQDIEEVIKYILEQNTPSSSSEVFSPDYNPLLIGKWIYDESIERKGAEARAHKERLNVEHNLRCFIENIWTEIDNRKSKYLML
jgi:hypothetical protein